MGCIPPGKVPTRKNLVPILKGKTCALIPKCTGKIPEVKFYFISLMCHCVVEPSLSSVTRSVLGSGWRPAGWLKRGGKNREGPLERGRRGNNKKSEMKKREH